MGNDNIANSIESEYEQWDNGDIVLISAPTGSGKTYFILHVYLRYAIQKNYRILYLVNRRILKEQIERDIETYSINIRPFIDVVTYQTLEQSIRDNTAQRFTYYNIVVADEAHYFLSDVTFNTSTQLSYNWIEGEYREKIRIYILATLDNLYEYMKNRQALTPSPLLSPSKTLQSNIYRFYVNGMNKFLACRPRPLKLCEYRVNRDYKDISVRILSSYEDIVREVKTSKNTEKWIIFVDNIALGKKLLEQITEPFDNEKVVLKEDEDVIFLSADYRNQSVGLGEVNKITSEQKQSAKVLICTSVMDNGISLKDEELRNIVIIIDTEEEFIQMLGRKRLQEDETIKLYIVNKSKEAINRRFTEIKKLRKSMEHFATELLQLENFIRNTNDDNNIIMKEQCIYWKQVQELLNRLLVNKDTSVLKYAYPKGYGIYVSLLAIYQIDYLYNHYSDLLKLYDEKGQYALSYQQLLWMKYSETEAEKIILRESMSIQERYLNDICEEFDKIKNSPLDKESFMIWYESVRKKIKALIDSYTDEELLKLDNGKNLLEQRKKVRNNVNRNSQVISDNSIDWLRSVCEFPYKLEKIKNGTTIIKFKIIKDEL